MKKECKILLLSLLVSILFCISVSASSIEWTCENCQRINKPEDKFCEGCGEQRIYKEYVNEPGRIDWVDEFFWNNSQGGISENFMFDFNTHAVATNYISFYFPESWDKGIQFTFNEKAISFFCRDVYLSEDEEDGLLCMIYREGDEIQDKKEYYVGNDGEYWYYFETFQDHVNSAAQDLIEIYEEQSSGLDIIRESILIENAQEEKESE